MTNEKLEKANFLTKLIKDMGQYIACDEWSGDEIIKTYQHIDTIIDAWKNRNNMPEGRSYYFYLNKEFKHGYDLRFVNDEIAEAIMNYIAKLDIQFKEL